jgi:hypothetical protein
MKKIATSFLIVFLYMMMHLTSFAQKTIVNETSENLGGSVNPAFTVFIENAEYKTVLKAWKALFEEHKGKIETNKNDVNVSNVVFPLLSSTPVAVFSRIMEDKTGVKITAAFTKEGQYVSGSRLPAETETVKKIMYDFAVSIKKNMIQEKLDDATKDLEKLQDKNKDLVNKKASLEKDIQNYNEKIKQAESDIQENIQQQAESKTKIESQTKLVEEFKTKLGSVE